MCSLVHLSALTVFVASIFILFYKIDIDKQVFHMRHFNVRRKIDESSENVILIKKLFTISCYGIG